MLSSTTLVALVALCGTLAANAAPWRPGSGPGSEGTTEMVAEPIAEFGSGPRSASAPAPLMARSESHQVTLVNRCGSGSPVFIYRDSSQMMGSTTISGPLYGGVAWLDGYADCGMSGVNCGTVEFSLINPGTDNANSFNSINYSLQAQGNHLFKYPMDFSYTGGCGGGAPGFCAAAEQCPGAFVGTDTASGTPVNCQGDNAGIVITFC